MPKRPEIFDELDRIAPLIPTPVYWIDTKYVIIGGNDLCLDAIGSEGKNINEALIGKTYYDYYPKEIADELTKMVKIVLDTNQSTKIEEKITDVSTGKFRYYETARAPLHDNKGHIVGTICSAIEITDKKETERLTIENAAHKAELEAQAKFSRIVSQVYHDITSPLTGLTTLQELLSALPPITSVDGYNIALMTDPLRSEDTIYLQKKDSGLKYEVLGSDKKLNQGFIPWDQLFSALKEHFPNNSSDIPLFQKECLPLLINHIIKTEHAPKTLEEKRVPEDLRIQLNKLIQRTKRIVNNLTKRSQPSTNISDVNDDEKVILLSALLMDSLSEKSFEYQNESVVFTTDFTPNSEFVFINVQVSQLSRSLSNLMNNAIQALDGNSGVVNLKLTVDSEYAHITIQDTGKGMSQDMIKRILNEESFTEGKKNGHGIGLGQVRDMLDQNFGKMNIQSESSEGTQITLSFSKHPAPAWAIEAIRITPADTIVILDDDSSIHWTWDKCFESILKLVPTIRIEHFEEGTKAIEFIQSFNDKDNLLLLTDFELLNQAKNGLDVIKEVQIKRSVLVTSHYIETNIQNEIMEFGAKLLPKQLANHIPILIAEPQAQYSGNNLKTVDAIWLDDDATFTDSISWKFEKTDKVDIYRTPAELMQNIHNYVKDTPIFLDNNFEGIDIHGTDIAIELHKKGFTKLFLLSGDLNLNENLSFLTILPKYEANNLKQYWKK